MLAFLLTNGDFTLKPMTALTIVGVSKTIARDAWPIESIYLPEA